MEWDGRTLTMVLKGCVAYEYFGVSPETVHELFTADSKGSYFARHIKGRYQCRKIEPCPR